MEVFLMLAAVPEWLNWQNAGLLLSGIVLTKIVGWLADWMEGKGQQWVHDRLEALQAKLNENSLLGQIQADDACTKIVENSIPLLFDELSETLKNDLKDGKLDKVEWQYIGGRLWEKVKPQIEGGKNDYLKNSSFADGKALAAWVAERWFKKQKAVKAGVVVELPPTK